MNRRVFVWLLLLAALAVVVPVRRWFAVDACLDAGGAFDYAHGRCSDEATAASEADSPVAAGAANRGVQARRGKTEATSFVAVMP